MSGQAQALPQPNQNTDQLITSILGVLQMASTAINFIPGVPPGVKVIVTTVITELNTLYHTYKANPTADVIQQAQALVDQAFQDVRNVLHPAQAQQPTP